MNLMTELVDIIVIMIIFVIIVIVKKIFQDGVSWKTLFIIGLLIFILSTNADKLFRNRRPSISRVKSDMRTIATAIESYYVDNKSYPANQYNFYRITTPISYLTSIPQDPFRVEADSENEDFGYHAFVSESDQKPYWILDSFGPDLDSDLRPYLLKNPAPRSYQDVMDITYDSSNGTVSSGDVFRFTD